MRQFLPENTTQQPDAVEQYVCLPLQACKVQPLTQESMESLIRLHLAPQSGIDKAIIELRKHYLPSGFITRVEAMPVTIDNRILVCILMEFDHVGIGGWLLLAYYLQWWAVKNNRTAVSFDDLCMRIFPMGFPSKDDLQRIWDNQKVAARPDNLIDHETARASFMPIKEKEHEPAYRS